MDKRRIILKKFINYFIFILIYLNNIVADKGGYYYYEILYWINAARSYTCSSITATGIILPGVMKF